MRPNKWLIICLFVLQALASGLFSNAHAASVLAEEGVAASTTGHCSADLRGKNGAPAQKRHFHSQCCILCVSGDHDFLRFPAVAPPILVFFAPEPVLGSAGRSLDSPDGRPTGWTNSWSSRAPPSFS